MKISRRLQFVILFLLLSILSLLLFIEKSEKEKDVLQKKVDLVFTNSISDSMFGLSMDYSKLDDEQKIQFYYQTLYNLHDALEVFNVSSYRKYNNLFLTLNRLYTFLLRNKNDNFEIEDKLYIFEFLGKMLVYPDDNQLISDFNHFLDSKKNINYSLN